MLSTQPVMMPRSHPTRVITLEPATAGEGEKRGPPPGLFAPPGLLAPPPGLGATQAAALLRPSRVDPGHPGDLATAAAARAARAALLATPPPSLLQPQAGKADPACGAASGTCSTADTDTEEPPSPDAEQRPPLLPAAPSMDALAATGSLAAPPSLPSEGSAGHWFGQCKPCAFFHKEGCQGGAACKFCHLCPPDEKRRRKQERKDVRRIAKSMVAGRL